MRTVSEIEEILKLSRTPAQDSPKHLLNALGDFCIQNILQNLTNLSDFVNASEVCTRFQDNAKACFHLVFKSTIDITAKTTCWNTSSYSVWNDPNNPRLSFKQQQCLLRNFGHLIYAIRMDVCSELNDNDPNLFQSVIKYCGKTLIELTVAGCLVDPKFVPCKIYSFENQFPDLKILDLSFIKVKNLHLSSKLEELRLCYMAILNFETGIRKYPKLLKLELTHFYGVERIRSFLKCNPQIKQLQALYDLFPFNYIQDVIPNLETYVCDVLHESFVTLIKPNLKYINVRKISENALIMLATKMPDIKRIDIRERLYIELAGLNGIKKTLELANNLDELNVRYMVLDSSAYYSILRSIKSRVKPCSVRVFKIVGVPDDIIEANSKWISIYNR